MNFYWNAKLILSNFTFDVFEDAYIDTLILKSTKNQNFDRLMGKTYSYPKKTKISSIENIFYKEIPQKNWILLDDKKFILILKLLIYLSICHNENFKNLLIFVL